MSDDQNTDIHELSGTSPEFRTQLAKQLEELVPEAIADGKVDMLKLKELLQDDAGDVKERFGLFWPGKKRAMRAAQEPTTATLKPAPELSKDWDITENIFIEGDNLEVLKILQKQYHNAIKMIYIDPPYNTGKDFVYPDNFKEGLANYLEFSQQVDAGNKKISTNTETQGRFHSNWLNMMYPRLKLARNLLTDDGVIFISIGDDEQTHLRKMCDEIFGEMQFIASICHKSRGSVSNDKIISPNHNIVLVYARNLTNVFKQRKNIGLDPKLDGFTLEDERGKYKHVPVDGPGGAKKGNPYYEFQEVKGYWRYSQDTMQKLFDEGKIVKLANSLQGKYYLSDAIHSRRTDTTWWDDAGYTSSATSALKTLMDGDYFDSPKAVSLITRMLKQMTHDDDIILDFFSGSGTTAHAVMQLNAEDGGNRKHIQVQLPEPTDEKSEAYKAGYRKISDIARERINRAGEKIKADFAEKLAKRDAPLDVGYRTFKLADTNFTKWQSAATNDLGELQARLDLMRESSDDSASEADLLVEVMLKLGLPLTARTAQRDVAGLTVHQVIADAQTEDNTEDNDTQPVFYLNEHVKPTLEQLRAIVTELTPSRFVILDDAFQGDNQLKTNLVQTCKSYDVELWTV